MTRLAISPSELYAKDERPIHPKLGTSIGEWRLFRSRVPRIALPSYARQTAVARVSIVWDLPQSKKGRRPLWRKIETLDGSQGFYAPRKMTGRDIIAEVAMDHGIHPVALIGQSRKSKIIRARQEAMYRLRAERGFSMPKIGSYIGGRDHTTVINGINRHCRLNGIDLPKGMKSSGRLKAE